MEKLKYRKIEDNEKIVENKGVVACSQYSHILYPEGVEAIHHGKGIEKIDGKAWEIFNVYHKTEDAYYGMPVLGLGLLNCFIRKEDTRKLSDKELEMLGSQTIGIFGSHTGKDSGQRYSVNSVEVVPKFS